MNLSVQKFLFLLSSAIRLSRITPTIFFTLLSFLGYAQNNTYNFLSEVLQSRGDTINLIANFNTILPNKEYEKYFCGEEFKDIWGAQIQTIKEWPSLDYFLSHLDLKHFLLLSNKEFEEGFDALIDFEQLQGNFIKSSFEDMEAGYPTKNYLYVSKPFFSCDQSWAMVSITSIFSGGSSGNYIYIYQKIKDKWVFYHRIELNIT